MLKCNEINCKHSPQKSSLPLPPLPSAMLHQLLPRRRSRSPCCSPRRRSRSSPCSPCSPRCSPRRRSLVVAPSSSLPRRSPRAALPAVSPSLPRCFPTRCSSRRRRAPHVAPPAVDRAPRDVPRAPRAAPFVVAPSPAADGSLCARSLQGYRWCQSAANSPSEDTNTTRNR